MAALPAGLHFHTLPGQVNLDEMMPGCREALVAELQSSLCSGPSDLSGTEFEVEALHVWRTPAGQTASWQHLEALPLQP